MALNKKLLAILKALMHEKTHVKATQKVAIREVSFSSFILLLFLYLYF